MAIENADFPAKRHPSLDGLAVIVWEKPDVAKTVLTSIANGGLIKPNEVEFSKLSSQEQARRLSHLEDQNLGVLGTGVLGIRASDPPSYDRPITLLVEEGMPEEFKETLKGYAPGVRIFVWEVSPDDPMVTGRWD